MPKPPPESWASTPAVRAVMRGNRSRNTMPELLLRSALHARGLRYRIHHRPIPGLRRNVDIAFTRARVAVEVRGCFWHSCPQHGTRPRTNEEYWNPKLARIRQRDAEIHDALANAGWKLIAVWEHEPVTAAADLIEALVREQTAERAAESRV